MANLVDERGEPRQLYGYQNDPAQVPHFRREYHRLQVEYVIHVNAFLGLNKSAYTQLVEKYAETDHCPAHYQEIKEKYDVLNHFFNLRDDPQTIPLTHEVSPNGDVVTILRDGDTWESVHFKMRKALDDRREETRQFYELITTFLMNHDPIENKEFIWQLQGPLRLLKHLAGHLHFD